LYRRKGFGETLEILNDFKKNEAKQSLFFNTLKNNKSYLNSFFRVKADLLKTGLIAYKLDEENDKVIYLTEKGKELFKKVSEIEEMVLKSEGKLKKD
jgi:predicted transcriptional regulator